MGHNETHINLVKLQLVKLLLLYSVADDRQCPDVEGKPATCLFGECYLDAEDAPACYCNMGYTNVVIEEEDTCVMRCESLITY